MGTRIFFYHQFLKKYVFQFEIQKIIILFLILVLNACKVDKKFPPNINSVSPSFGNILGGDLITISGRGFEPGAKIFIENLLCTPVSLSSIEITCLTPSQPIGTYSLTVTNPNKQTHVLNSAFTYMPARLTS